MTVTVDVVVGAYQFLLIYFALKMIPSVSVHFHRTRIQALLNPVQDTEPDINDLKCKIL